MQVTEKTSAYLRQYNLLTGEIPPELEQPSLHPEGDQISHGNQLSGCVPDLTYGAGGIPMMHFRKTGCPATPIPLIDLDSAWVQPDPN